MKILDIINNLIVNHSNFGTVHEIHKVFCEDILLDIDWIS